MKIKILDTTTDKFLDGDFSLGVESGEIRGIYGEKFPELKPIFLFNNAEITNEAIFILEKEKKLLEDCLKGWKSENHPEAFKQRNKKLKEINNALCILKN